MASNDSNPQPTSDSSATSHDYELLVIGGGSGGLVAAKQAAKQGIKVGLIESAQLGGTCANRGCVPKKLMHYAAEFAHQQAVAQDYGWGDSKQNAFNWDGFREKLHSQLANIRGSIGDSVKEAGVELVRGRAEFIDAHRLTVKGSGDAAEQTRELSAERIIVAVGGQPLKLDLPGIELALTSRDVFKLEKLPRSMVIVGGGYIGVEFSGIFTALGVEVTLVDTDPLPLQNFDQSLREGVLTNLKEQGVRFVGNASLESIRSGAAGAGSRIASFGSTDQDESGEGESKQQELEADIIVIATGRTPNLEPLSLEAAGVDVEKGAIAVNHHYQTSQSNIYAIGDCINRLPLTPVAQAEACYVIDHVYGDGEASVDYRWMPSAVFSMPPSASVGWTEAAAKEKQENITCYSKEVTPLSHVLSEIAPHSRLKWIVDADSDQVLGLHVLGASAPDIVQGLTPLLKRGISHSELEKAVGIHPTFGEELFCS